MLRARFAAGLALAVLVAAAGCSRTPPPPRPAGAAPASDTQPAQVASPSVAGEPDPEGFEASVDPVPASVRRRMDGVSMRRECPVGYEELRYLRVSYRDFDGQVQTGELVVNADSAEAVVEVFRSLFAQQFPIRHMTLVDDYGRADDPDDGADDFASIEADNTSAFNCRTRTGSTTEFSQHSYGRALDLNPLENPYVSRSGKTAHPRSVPYLDRGASRSKPGVIVAGGPVVAAFASIGWHWGGDWSGVRDLQHFSATGR